MASAVADGFPCDETGTHFRAYLHTPGDIDAVAKRGSFHVCCGYHRTAHKVDTSLGCMLHEGKVERQNGRGEIAHRNIGSVPWVSRLMNSWVRRGSKRLLCCNAGKEARERAFCQRCIASKVIGFSLDRPVSTTLSSCHLWPTEGRTNRCSRRARRIRRGIGHCVILSYCYRLESREGCSGAR